MRQGVWLIAAVLLASACGGSSKKSLPPSAGRSVEDTIAYAKQYGFYEGESVDAAAKRVRAEHAEEYGEPFDPNDELTTLFVLGYDHKRVWWHDTESDVGPGNEMYVDALEGLATISRGRFEPENIREEWSEEYGTSVDVSYELDGVPKTLSPAYLDDYLDMEILCEINEQIAASDLRFEIVDPFDQTAYVVALTEREHAGLTRLLPKLRRDPCGIASEAAEMGQEAEQEVLEEAGSPGARGLG